MKYLVFILMLSTLASCAGLPGKGTTELLAARAPAETSTCAEMIKNFFSSNKKEKELVEVLAERKLITFSEKKAQIHYPRLEWVNRVKKSLNSSLRNWNNNRYPAFYLFNQEDIIPVAKKYAENLEKVLANTVPLEDEEITKAYLDVTDWMKAFQNYKSELDQLIEERISLQYNISLLKKIELDAGETRDVQITIKRGGVLKNEIITLRKEDKNLKATINKLKLEMKELDGSILKNGKIKERIVRQAMLLDMLIILHREMEYVIKNTTAPNIEMINELTALSLLIKKSDFSPSTYGVYKIENKIFIRELLAASKLDVAYAKIKEPLTKLKTVITDYFQNKKAGTDQEKVGILKRLYAKITSITPKQAAIGGGSVVVAGIGYQRYFAIKDHVVTEELNEAPPLNELEADDQAHEQQLEETKKVEVEKHEGNSSVVEIHIDELTANE